MEFLEVSGGPPEFCVVVGLYHKSLKSECIRPGTPLSLQDARRLVEGYVEHYHSVRPETLALAT